MSSVHLVGLSLVLTLGLIVSSSSASVYDNKTRVWCLPDDSCWPPQAKIDELKGKVQGKLLQVTDYKDIDDFGAETASYTADTKSFIMSQRYITKPGIIVEVANADDVKECILFAKKYNIKLSVITSGHDFIGRNTAPGSLQINLYHLRNISVNINETQYGSAGTVEVGVGNNWARVYKELDENYNRVIVGGASPQVSMGGYTLGGGHSPLTRKLGLAVDNVIAIHLVTAGGAIGVVTKDGWNFTEVDGKVNASNDPDLFWALRGGGGGTFGVVTKIKFKIHQPPSSFQHMVCTWIYSNIRGEAKPAEEFFNFFGEFMDTLPDEWGGYLLFGADSPGTAVSLGYILVSLVHWGDRSQAEQTIKPLKDWGPYYRVSACNMTSYPSFWKMWHTNNDTTWSRTYIYSGNVMPSSWTTSLTNDIIDSQKQAVGKGVYVVATGTLMGGKATTFSDDSSSVVPGLRRANMAISFGTASPSASEDEKYINAANEAAQKFYKHTTSGYVNEPDFKKSDWKTYYWGNNYDRLLTLKKKWDPEFIFTCHHCVGDNGGPVVAACASMTVISFLLMLANMLEL